MAKSPDLWPLLFNYLAEHDLALGVGTGQFPELAEADRLHESLTTMLTCLPSALIKTPDTVLAEEVAAHPGRRTDSLLLYPLNALLGEKNGPETLRQYLSSPSLQHARRGQRELADQSLHQHAELKSNFPPAQGEKYTRAQANRFAWMQVVQWLAEAHTSFLKQFEADIQSLQVRSFPSVRLFGREMFFKFYLGGREPSRTDFGDMAHLFALPYCNLVIMERDLASTLRQIKRHDEVLCTTDIHDIDFFKHWPGPTH